MRESRIQWYVLRVPYGRELKLKEVLDEEKIVNFVAMRCQIKTVNGRQVRVEVPAICNIIFIKSTRSLLHHLKQKMEGVIPFRYIIDPTTKSPMVVPQKEMEFFIAIAGSMHEQVLYLSTITPSLLCGDRVRVKDGIFKSVEGRVVKIKKDKRVMVMLNSQIAITTGFIHPMLLEKMV